MMDGVSDFLVLGRAAHHEHAHWELSALFGSGASLM